MAISFVAATTASGTSGTSRQINVPAGVQDGDLLLLTANLNPQSNTSITGGLTGWTALSGSPVALDDNEDGSSPFAQIFGYYRIANSEPASYTPTWANSGQHTLAMAAYRGVDQAAPIDTQVSGRKSVDVSGAITDDILALAIDPVIADALLVVLGATGNGSTFTAANGFTEAADVRSGTGSTSRCSWAGHKQLASGAARSQETAATQDDAHAADGTVSFTLALKPAASGQTVAIGQAAETDTAQSVAVAPLRRLIGQVTETATVQAVTLNPARRLIGQAVELDTAPPVAVAPKHRLIGQVTETDTAPPVTGGLVAPEAPPRRVAVSQPVDDRLFVEVAHANGRKSRWGDDEPEASGIPEGISFTDSAPGGFNTFGCHLARDPRRTWPDLDLLDEIVCYGPTRPLGRNAFEGQMEQFPSELGDRYQIGVNAIGHQAQLEDRRDYVDVIVDRSPGAWREPDLDRRIAYSNVNFVYGTDYAAVSELGGVAFEGQVNKSIPDNSSAELWYMPPAGVRIEKFGYKGANVNAANVQAATIKATDTLAAAVQDSYALTLDDTARIAVLITAARRYLFLQARASATHTPGAQFRRTLSRLAVYADHGLPLQPISGEPDGVFGHDALGHFLSGTGLDYTIGPGGTITDANKFVVPQLAFLDPTTRAEAIAQLNAYFLYNWAVWESKRFWWQPWDPSVLTWKARIQGGAHWTPVGRQASTLFNGVVVVYTDVTGKRRTAGPPGSGCDDESELLEDTDPANPVTRHGRTRWELLDVDFPLTGGATGSAVQIGYVWMQEHRIPQRRGTLVVRPLGQGHIPQLEHPTAGPMPVWACRSGDFVDLVDFPDPEPFKVISKTYDHPTKTLTLELDNTSMKIRAILERVGVRSRGALGS